MKHWNLYSSGIRIAEFMWDGSSVMHRLLDPATASYLPQRSLSAEENENYRNVTHLNPLELFQRLSAYDQAFSGGQDEIQTVFGDRYQRADEENYVQRDIKFPCNVTVADGRVTAFTCPSRERVHVLTEQGYEDLTVLAKWKSAYPKETIHPVLDGRQIMVPMRDGVKLSTAVLLPADVHEALPTILVRTPYGKESDIALYERYVQRGYAVVLQDVRGRNRSEGEWIPNYHEVEDGDDTLNWIAARPWSNGRVGTIGGSYLGYVQWAAAASGNPHLCAMISVVCAGSAFLDLPRKGGSFVSGMLAWAFAVSQREFHPELMERDDWDEVLNIRPLGDIPKKALGYDIPFYTEWLKHAEYDDFWRMGNWSERSAGAVIPTLIMSGWFDDNGMGTTEALDLTKDWPTSLRKVILGPWPHSGNARYDVHGLALGSNALKLDIDLTFLQWFDRHLKEMENGAEQLSPVQYYTLGSNIWKNAQAWPPADSQPVSFYLSGGSCDDVGCRDTDCPDGVLLTEIPKQDRCRTYTYDPTDPASCLIDLSENEIGVPEDYTEQDARPDVLCYTTPPLTEDLTLTGDFTVELFVSSDAPDTDFVVRINEVDESGRSTKLADGLLCARFRNGFEKAELMEPGRVYQLSIRTTKLSNTFLKGHRLRLTVTSSAKNLIFPHSNTPAGCDSAITIPAQNKVHHGPAFPSRLIARREPD